ncbi:MAG: amidohydrolase family protein, partial [Desulfurococcaceae archaeon]
FYEDTIQESLNTIEALHAYTYGSAYVMHDERELGSLEQGKFADLLVIDRDPLSTPERELRYIRVLEVYVGGARVWPK